MNTHDILLTVQYITISVLFLELLIIFIRWKNSIHSYLFLACLASFISNIGYLFELKAESEEAYITALKLSYVGRVFIVFAFFIFSARMCRRRIPAWLLFSLLLTHISIYISVLTIGKNDLYYPEYRFVRDSAVPTLAHSNGYMHDLLMGLNVVLAVIAICWLIIDFRKEQNKRSKSRMLMVITAFGIQLSSFLLQVAGVFDISDYYDLTMPGALLGTIFMLIGIFGFDLLGTREIAREFAVDRISEGIIAVDNEGRVQYYNEPAAKLYPEFKSFFHINTGTDEDSHEKDDPENAENRKKEKKHIYTPYDIISIIAEAVKNGETLKINGRIYSPEENDLFYKGESYGKLYVLVDDTEHFEYMEELQKQRDIADSANEAKSRFLANMSHEIRTPINAVLGMDEMILRESGEKTIRGYAADIMSAGRTLLSLINDILDLSKVEEGKMEIIPVKYDLSSLVNDLVNMIRDRANSKGLKFIVEADEHIPHLLTGDEIRLRQCVMNLLTNAVKYTNTGEVRLKVTFEKKDNAHIFLCFTVKDTGIGMKAEDMENLFSPYKRLEEKRNRAIEGTGLGMSITRQLLDLMGSRLSVESEYGKGSVFSFSVEQKVNSWEELGDYSLRYADKSEDIYEYHELFHAPDARILVVDDTEMNLTVVRNLLKKTGINIDTAASGKAAVALAGDNLYDVIFIDHMMPEMDGIETLKHIRQSGKSMNSPSVALTANAVSGAREMYLEAGFTDYLSKPISGEKLEKMLAKLIPDEKLLPPEDDPEASADGAAKAAEEEARAKLEPLFEGTDIIDAETGIKNCGSAEGYLSVLSVFHQTAAAKSDEIEELLKNGDLKNYTIKVHALKSSARIVGAAEIFELARSLEEAGKDEDIGFIGENNERLLMMYRGLNERLGFLDRSDEDLPEISEKALSEAYQTMFEIAGSMDYGMMEEVLKELKGYKLSDQDAGRIARIESALNELDWEGIIAEANKAADGIN